LLISGSGVVCQFSGLSPKLLIPAAPPDEQRQVAADADGSQCSDPRLGAEQCGEGCEVVKPFVGRAERVNQHDRRLGRELFGDEHGRDRAMEQLVANVAGDRLLEAQRFREKLQPGVDAPRNSRRVSAALSGQRLRQPSPPRQWPQAPQRLAPGPAGRSVMACLHPARPPGIRGWR
jgi:hypothetical protein